MLNIVEYLQSKGHTLKPSTGGWHMLDCIFCKGKKDLAVKETNGVYYCHKCGETGNLWKLKKHFGELPVYKITGKNETVKKMTEDKTSEYIKNLMKEKEAWNYLRVERGFSKEAIAHFRLGYKDGFISIPYYVDGYLVNIKYKKPNTKEYRRETGSESTLFNVDGIDKSRDILLVEGEGDCIAAWQMGFNNVISIPNGAGSIKEDWIDFFDGCSGNIYIAYDNDEPGEKGAIEISRRIGFERCCRVILPLNDFNDVLMGGYSFEDITNGALKTAKQYSPPAFVHMDDFKEKLDEFFMKGESERKGFQLPEWELFNSKIGGLRETEITVISGETGSGKSTFALNIFCYLLKLNQPVLIVSSEMPALKVLVKMFSIYIGKAFYEFNQEEYTRAYEFFKSKELYFIDIHGSLTIDDLSEYVEYGNRKHGIKYVLLDHLHFFIDSDAEKMVQKIGQFMRKLVLIALKTQIHIFLIAHPSKLKNDGGYVHMNDLKGACVVGNTKVNGKRIKNIVENNLYFPVNSFDTKNGKKKKVTPSELMNTGILPCYRIKTESGKTIIVSAETKLYTDSGWVKSTDLTTANKILIQTN